MKREIVKMDAYLTVEAALVMPVVLGAVIFTLYMLFFQYDRCLMEQNTGILALRACTLQIDDREELMRELMAQADEEDGRYLVWDMEEAMMQFRGNRMQVNRSGRLAYPFFGLMPVRDEAEWESSIVYENYRIQPVDFIRNCRKILGGK